MSGSQAQQEVTLHWIIGYVEALIHAERKADIVATLKKAHRLLEAGQRLAESAENYASSDPDMSSHKETEDEFDAALLAYQEAAKPQERKGD